MRMRRLRARLALSEGSAVVEFALVAPFLLLIVFAIVDLSRAYYTANQLVSAVREGARVAAVLQTPEGADADQVRAAVKRFVPYGSRPIADDQIGVAVAGPLGARTVTVSVSGYVLPLVTPFARTVGLPSISFSRAATFRWELN